MGNFSKDPDIALKEALERGYSRLLFQQGKPVLDRELNLLAYLAGLQRLVPYLGDGVPAGSNGFAVSNIQDNDFAIADGLCLVNGQEVRLANPTTYKTQPNKDHVAELPQGKSNVYLRVFPVEVTATQDEDLGNANAGDVGFETSVREKTDWEIVVSAAGIDKSNHFLIAEIDTAAGAVVDLRRQALTLAALRDELDRARGSVAELAQRLNTSLLADGNLRPGAVTESALADNAVSTRTIADGAVPIQKLSTTVVFDLDVSVAASGPGQVGEEIVTVLSADAPAFLLVSVHLAGPRPQSTNLLQFFTVDWWHKITVRKQGADPYQHFHQIVISNPTSFVLSVSCKAYRLDET